MAHAVTWPSDVDPDDELFAVIAREEERQNTTIQLIASENFTSPAVLRATGSVLTNKYAEGYPGKRYYGGNQDIDESEALAIERAKELFGAEHANVQPHSGANANMAVYLGLLEPGDTILGLSLAAGTSRTAHRSTPAGCSTTSCPTSSARATNASTSTRCGTRRRAPPADDRCRCNGLSAPHRGRAGQRADEVGALLMFDIAHIAGLIAGGAHSEPGRHRRCRSRSPRTRRRGRVGERSRATPSSDRASTRRSSPGSRAARSSTSSPPRRWRSGGHAPVVLRDAHQIVTNAAALAEGLAAGRIPPGVQRDRQPLMLVDLRTFDADLDDARRPERPGPGRHHPQHNTIPDDPRSPFVTSGVRIGTPRSRPRACAKEMAAIAELIARALRHRDDPAASPRSARTSPSCAASSRLPGLRSPCPISPATAFVGFVAAFVTMVTTPVVRRVALHFGWVVPPDDRRMHPAHAIDRRWWRCLGLAAVGAAWQMDRFSTLFDGNSEPLGVMLGRGDLRRRARRRPAPHLRRPRSRASSSPEPSSPGSASRYFRVPFSDVYSIGADWVPLITVIWLPLMANAVNLIDGLDGLAAGIVAIASGTFFLLQPAAQRRPRLEAPNIGPLLAVITLGMCVGFLPHNFNPARIFMGGGGCSRCSG